MMAGIGAAGGANPLSGMASTSIGGGGTNPLAGIGGSMGIGTEDSSGGGMAGGGSSGLAPTIQATSSQGSSFGEALQTMIVDGPSASKANSTELAARFAAGDKSIDAHTVAIASAKAGVEIQMATRTISSAVSSVRTLFQMQV